MKPFIKDTDSVPQRNAGKGQVLLTFTYACSVSVQAVYLTLRHEILHLSQGVNGVSFAASRGREAHSPKKCIWRPLICGWVGFDCSVTLSNATLLKNLAGVGHGGGSSLILVAASLAATIATILICAKSAQLGAITKLIDRPDLGRKRHLRDTPIVGGLAVMVPTLLLSVGYVMTFPAEPFLLAATFASSVILAIGVLDDRLDLSPAWRFTALFYVVFVAFSVEPQFVVHSVGIKFSRNGHRSPVPFPRRPDHASYDRGLCQCHQHG